MEEYFAEMESILAPKYIELIGLSEVTADMFKSIPRGTSYYRINGNIGELLFNHPIDKTTSILTVFRATTEGTNAIYSMLYSGYTEEGFVNKYLVHGPTFQSQDGEYRGRFISMGTYNAIASKFAAQMDLVEEFLVGKFNAGMLTLDVMIYFPAGFSDESKSKFRAAIDAERFTFKFLAFCWLYDAPRISAGTFETHIHPAYLNIITRLFDEDLLASVTEKFGSEEQYDSMLYWFSRKSTEKLDVVHFHPFLETGQKLIPLKVSELMNAMDISYPSWRELTAMYFASDMIINLVCPCFPCINTWFIIQDTDVGMFDNYSMVIKHEHSKIAAEIQKIADSARNKTFKNETKVFGPINGNFYRLGKKITRAMNFIDENLRLAPAVLGIHMEHTGKTFRHLVDYIQRSPRPCPEDSFVERTELFHKHIFEIIYANVCMFDIAGVVHGDLHLNNAAIYVQDKFYTEPDEWKLLGITDPHVYYYVKEGHIYDFPHVGCYSILLDFSRCLILHVDDFLEEYGEAYVLRFKKNQYARMHQILAQQFPGTLKKYQEQLELISMRKHRALIKVFSLVDVYTFCHYLAEFLPAALDGKRAHVRELKVRPECIEFVRSIAARAEERFKELLGRVIEDPDFDEASFDLPTQAILEEFFAPYRRTSFSECGGDAVDVFNMTNKLHYHISSRDKGPLLDFALDAEIRQKHGIKLPKDKKQLLKKLETHVSEEGLYSYQKAIKDEFVYEDPYAADIEYIE